MQTFTPADIAQAEKIWRETCYSFTLLEQAVQPILNAEAVGPWLKVVRRATFKRVSQLARNLHVLRTEYYKLEQAEESGDITLRRLRECAKALDCELIYYLRPTDRQNFSISIWRKILPQALKIKAPQFAWTRVNALSSKLIELTHDPRFRQKQGWCRNQPGRGKVLRAG